MLVLCLSRVGSTLTALPKSAQRRLLAEAALADVWLVRQGTAECNT